MRLPRGLVFWMAIAADNVAAHSVASGWFGPPVLIVALVTWSCGPMDRASALRAGTASSSPAETTAPPYVAHGCLSGYGVSESLDSVTELEPRQTQQFSYLFDGVFCCRYAIAAVAQLVERALRTRAVAGSTPQASLLRGAR